MDETTNKLNETVNDPTQIPSEETTHTEGEGHPSEPTVPDDYYLPEDEYGNTIYTSEWLKKYTSISGWLGFFLFAIGAGAVISTIFILATTNSDEYAGNMWLTMADPIIALCGLGVAIYTIYAFNKRKPNAVFFAKLYLIIIFATNIFALIGGEFDSTGLNTAKRAVQGVIFSIFWFIYLCVSKQVEQVIPSSFRKATKRDWLTAIGILVLPFLMLGIGLVQITSIVNERDKKSEEILSIPISEHERTDGKIIFTIPYSFSCTESDVEIEQGLTIKLFDLENEQVASGYLCSDYDDMNQSKFNEYRENWKEEDVKYKTETPVDNGVREVNGNKCFYKVVSYDMMGAQVYWRFYILYNQSTGKVAVASFYDNNEDTSYIDELMESIRFN